MEPPPFQIPLAQPFTYTNGNPWNFINYHQPGYFTQGLVHQSQIPIFQPIYSIPFPMASVNQRISLNNPPESVYGIQTIKSRQQQKKN